MIFRSLTTSGDWTFGAGLANYATAQKAIAFNIQTSILMWKGDCFFSLANWINWKGLLNVGQQSNLNNTLQSQLSRCYGVIGIVSATAQFNATTRNVVVTYTVNTVYSTQVKNQVAILSSNVGAQ